MLMQSLYNKNSDMTFVMYVFKKLAIQRHKELAMYIDAGTGSMMLQILAAGFFTMLLFFKNIRARFKKAPCQQTVKNKETGGEEHR